MVKQIDLGSFDLSLKEIANIKVRKNIVKGRYDIESISIDSKSSFIIQFLLSIKSITGITYKVFFWEKDSRIHSFFVSNFQSKNYQITISYENGKKPGIFCVKDTLIDPIFLSILLSNHFNYELGITPSLNLRVQICIDQEQFVCLLDIYDDRGFDVYYLIDK